MQRAPESPVVQDEHGTGEGREAGGPFSANELHVVVGGGDPSEDVSGTVTGDSKLSTNLSPFGHLRKGLIKIYVFKLCIL